MRGLETTLNELESAYLDLIESDNEDRMDNKPISYEDCANALLMMWMENILTDSEYNRNMDKLNANKDKFDIT